MPFELNIVFHGLTLFVRRREGIEACLLQPPSTLGWDHDRAFALFLTGRTTAAIPLVGEAQLTVRRVIETATAMTPQGAEFLLDPILFDAEERDTEARFQLPIPEIITSARYNAAFGRNLPTAGDTGSPGQRPAVAHILTYTGLEYAELAGPNGLLWRSPKSFPAIPGVQTDCYVGPVYLVN